MSYIERYTFIWIEGWENLHEFCQKRFNERPRICESYGYCNDVRIHRMYKEDKDGNYHEMYFLYMRHHNGEYDSLNELHEKVERAWDYEKIRADRRAILRS